MGLFSTVTHIYQKEQIEIVNELSNELLSRGLLKLTNISIRNVEFNEVFDRKIKNVRGQFYLITSSHGQWKTIIELNVNIDNGFYLYETTKSLSKRLNTYVLSFYLHDSDVLLYNLEEKGNSLDGYNSNYQYFLHEAADREEVLSQRHTPIAFSGIIPSTKNVETLNQILNEGYWDAFDNYKLDDDGVPVDDKYFIDEEDRFIRVGKYLEIFNGKEYPFADWYFNIHQLNLDECYLLKAERP